MKEIFSITVYPSQPIDESLLAKHDTCVTGAAVRQFEGKPSWKALVRHTWVYASGSPSQKEFILTSLKSLGYTTTIAVNGTNDVGVLRQVHLVALRDGSSGDLKKMAEHQRIERLKKVHETLL